MEGRYFLESSELMAVNNRIVFPESVLDLEFLETGSDVFWAYDREEDVIVVVQDREIFEADDRYDYLGERRLKENRVSTYPSEILDGYEYWEMEELVCFIVMESEVQNGIVRIIPEDQAGDGFSALSDMK